MGSKLLLNVLAATGAFGPTSDQPMKLGDVAVTGAVRLRVHGWDWFQPASGTNAYAYSNNILRLNFAEKRKGWEGDAELAAPFLIGLPDTATATAPHKVSLRWSKSIGKEKTENSDTWRPFSSSKRIQLRASRCAILKPSSYMS